MSVPHLDLARARAELLRAREALLHRQGDERASEEELFGAREADPGDAAAAEVNALPLDALTSSEQSRLADIADALKRIEEGRYGVCEECGGAIEQRRLEVVPWTRRCFSCELEFEKEHRGVNVI